MTPLGGNGTIRVIRACALAIMADGGVIGTAKLASIPNPIANVMIRLINIMRLIS